jgi:hypothetical protein
MIGAVGAAATYAEYNAHTSTKPQFDSLQLWNTVSWVGVGVGAGAFAASFFIRSTPRATTWLELHPGGVAIAGTY